MTTSEHPTRQVRKRPTSIDIAQDELNRLASAAPSMTHEWERQQGLLLALQLHCEKLVERFALDGKLTHDDEKRLGLAVQALDGEEIRSPFDDIARLSESMKMVLDRSGRQLAEYRGKKSEKNAALWIANSVISAMQRDGYVSVAERVLHVQTDQARTSYMRLHDAMCRVLEQGRDKIVAGPSAFAAMIMLRVRAKQGVRGTGLPAWKTMQREYLTLLKVTHRKHRDAKAGKRKNIKRLK